MKNEDRAPNQSQVDMFDYLSPMLDSALNEMREFSKKKQDGIVSETKIKILNRILSDISEIVAGEDTAGYLDLLDDQGFLQNSDAVLVLGQYRSALESFRSAHVVRGDWVTKESITDRGY